MDPLQTHTYDGKWQDTLSIIKRHQFFGPSLSMAAEAGTTSELFVLYPKISKGHQFFSMIMNGNGNWDSANEVNAKILLCFLALMYEGVHEKEEMCKVLGEQLQDMATGSCPQGRTTRLAQVIVSYLD
jgi:hypothetical protein